MTSTEEEIFEPPKKKRKRADDEEDNLGSPECYKAGLPHGEKGRIYEKLMIAKLVLYLSLDNEIKNFKIKAEDEGFRPFDDVVVDITMQKRQDTEHKYAIQLKYAENNETLNFNNHFKLTEEKLRNFQQNQQKYQPIFLTSRKADISKRKYTLPNKLVLEILKQKSPPMVFAKIFKQEHCYSFRPKNESGASVWQNVLLYTDQMNNEEIEKDIKDLFKKEFSCTDTNSVDMYIGLINNWRHAGKNRTVLRKAEMKNVIAWCLFHPDTSFWTPRNEDLHRNSELFRDATLLFTTVTLQKDQFQKIKNMWHHLEFEEKEKIEELYQIMYANQLSVDASNDNKDNEEFTKLLFLSKKYPLAVKYSDVTSKVIEKLCPHHKFILLYQNQQPTLEDTFKNLNDLYKKSKTCYKHITKNFKCSLQGKEEQTLEDLIGENEEIRKIITTNQLVEMLEKPFLIGKKQEENSEIYIERSLTRNIIKDSFLSTVNTNETLILLDCVLNWTEFGKRFSCFNKLSLEEFLHESEGEETDANNSVNVILSETECSETKFVTVCKKVEHKTCHHFRMIGDEGYLEWIHSTKNVNELRDYIFVSNKYITEQELIPTEAQINLICAQPDMGKSKLLNNIKNTKKNCPLLWSLFIVARDHAPLYAIIERAKEEIIQDHAPLYRNAIIERAKEEIIQDHAPLDRNAIIERAKKEIIEEIIERFKNDYGNFEYDLLKIFAETGRMCYYWDGLDELSEENLDIVKRIIDVLKTDDSCTIWISSRSTLQNDLECHFNVLARSIKEFDQTDQENYIEKLGNSIKNKALQIYDQIQKNNYQLISDLRTPLLFYLLVELIKKNPNVDVSFLERSCFSAVDLYQHFIEKKIEIWYYTIYKENPNNTKQPSFMMEYKNDKITWFEEASLKLYFEASLLKKWGINAELKPDSSIKQEFAVVENNTIKFYHSSFGEYFAALYLSKNKEKVSDIDDFGFHKKYDNIRFFLYLMWSREHALHVAICNVFDQKLCEDSNSVHEENKNNKNILELACGYCNNPRYSLVENKNNERYISESHCRRFKLDQNSDDYIAESGADCSYSNILDLLLSYFRDSEEQIKPNEFVKLPLFILLPIVKLIAFKNDTLQTYNLQNIQVSVLYYCIQLNIAEGIQVCDEAINVKVNGKSIFHHAVLYGSDKILEEMLKRKDYKKKLLDSDEPLIRIACEKEKYKIAKLLLENKITVKTNKRNDQMLLHSLYKKKKNEDINCKEIFTLLVENIQTSEILDLDDDKGETLIHYACMNEEYDIVELLTKNGANINVSNSRKMTPLHYACKMGHDDIVNCLLKHGAESHHADIQGRTPIHHACKNQNMHIVRRLLKTDIDLDAKDIYGKACIHYACEATSHDILELLLAKDADGKILEAEDANCRTPLQYVCISGNTTMFSLLNEKNANVETRDRFGKQPIHYACENGHLEIAKVLIQKCGVDQWSKDDQGRNEKLPIHYACAEGHHEVVEHLIASKTQLNVEDINGEMPLNRAIYREHYQTAIFLIQHGVRVDTPDKFGETPMHYFCKKDRLDIVKLLISKNPQTVNIPNKQKKYPIHYACEEGRYEVVEYLLNRVENVEELKQLVEVVDADRKTPLHRACERGHEDIVRLLLSKETSPNVRDKYQKLPIHGACKHGHHRIVKLLLEKQSRDEWDVVDENGKKPMNCAVDYKKDKNRREDIFRLLIQSNADLNAKIAKGKRKGQTILHKLCGEKLNKEHRNNYNIVRILVAHGAQVDVQDEKGDLPLCIARRRVGYGIFKLILKQ